MIVKAAANLAAFVAMVIGCVALFMGLFGDAANKRDFAILFFVMSTSLRVPFWDTKGGDQ